MATGGDTVDLNEPSTSAETASAERVDNASTKRLFVGNLHQQITKQNLIHYFERFGTVSHVHVVPGPITKPEVGYGFVVFEESSSTDSVLKIRRHAIAGHRVDVERAKIRKRKPDDCKVFVGGLAEHMTDVDLIEYFSRFGRIEEVMIPNLPIPAGQQKYAFLLFETKEIAESVYAKKFHTIKSITVTCEKPWAKPERTQPSSASRTPTPENLE